MANYTVAPVGKLEAKIWAGLAKQPTETLEQMLKRLEGLMETTKSSDIKREHTFITELLQDRGMSLEGV